MRRIARSLIALAAAATVPLAAASAWASPNTDFGSILTLTAQSVGQAVSTDQSNPNSSILKCIANLTTVSAGQVVLSIQGRDRGSGQYFNLLTTNAIFAAGVYPLSVGPSLQPSLATGVYVVNDAVPLTFRVVATVLGPSTASVTGSVGCSQLD